jgi:hypothetical protein
VRIDVADVGGSGAPVLQAPLHCPHGSLGVGPLVSDAIGVACAAVPRELGKDASAASASEGFAFQHEDGRTLADDESIAIRVEGTAGTLWVGVAARQRAEHAEAEHTDRVDHRVRAAGEDDIGVAALDRAESLADRLGAGGAGGGDRVVRASRILLNRDMRGGEVGQSAEDRDRVRALAKQARKRREIELIGLLTA